MTIQGSRKQALDELADLRRNLVRAAALIEDAELGIRTSTFHSEDGAVEASWRISRRLFDYHNDAKRVASIVEGIASHESHGRPALPCGSQAFCRIVTHEDHSKECDHSDSCIAIHDDQEAEAVASIIVGAVAR